MPKYQKSALLRKEKDMRNKYVKSIIAVILLIALFSAFAAEVYAANTKTVNLNWNNKTQYATIQSGSGLWYALGWKKTTITVKNTGKNWCYIDKNLGRIGYVLDGGIGPGQTRTYSLTGSDAKGFLRFRYDGGPTSLKITTDAGSVW